jgi:hypothetical protein
MRIKDRYLIVPINLQSATPSRQRSSVEIFEAHRDDALVDFVVQSGTAKRKRRRRKRDAGAS